MPRAVLCCRLVALLLLAFVASARAGAAERDDTVVSLVVCDSGSDVYELEGHAALRVRTPGGMDVAVNWGLFDFAAPGFVWRFALGRTDYMCGAAPWPYFEQAYRSQGRRVTEYVLDLDSAETRRVVELLQQNLLPENATYRYNYVKDNCATRPLRLVEAAIGDSIVVPDVAGAGSTFREVMRRCHSHYPWYQFGIDLALGSGIDYAITEREKTFAPVVLERQLAGARRGDGRPLVSDSTVVVDLPAGAMVRPSTPWWATPMAVAVALLVLTVAVTVADVRRGRVSRWYDACLFGLFGLMGCLLFFLTFFSSHEATSPNYLLAWLNPLCLIPVIFIWIKSARRLVMCYQIANFAVILLFCAAWPLLPQSANAAIWPLVAADALRSANYIALTLRKSGLRRQASNDK